MAKPRIAVFSGPTATIQNSEPLVTSNKAREQHGLPLAPEPDGSPMRFDALRPQRLAAPVTVYVEQFSAHPLERDAAELYGPPDGYLDASGAFHRERQGPNDVPSTRSRCVRKTACIRFPTWRARPTVRRGKATAWRRRRRLSGRGSRSIPTARASSRRSTGWASTRTASPTCSPRRPTSTSIAPRRPAATRRACRLRRGPTSGPATSRRRRAARDFFPYRPVHLRAEPPMATLARLTNVVQRALASGRYAGAIWLEGSPNVEETTYWLNLLIDTPVPIVGNASQRPHGAASNDGDRNIVDSVDYIVSRIWADADGRDSVGAVVIQDEQIFTSRDVQKADARPGGYVATGGHGGIVGLDGPARTAGPDVPSGQAAHVHVVGEAIGASQDRRRHAPSRRPDRLGHRRRQGRGRRPRARPRSPRSRSSSTGATSRTIRRATPRPRSTSSRGSTRTCGKRRWPASSPRVRRRSAPCPTRWKPRSGARRSAGCRS